MSDQSFFPGLYPADYKRNPRAARLVADLININYLPEPLPDGLPKPWRVAIQAIAHVRHTDHNTRWRAFMESTKDYPYAMVDEVNTAGKNPALDRAEKDRILYRLKDVIQPPPPRTWVVDGILSSSSLNLLVGDPGSKKTYMAVDLALCVAMGKPWLGRAIGSHSPIQPVVGAGSPRPQPSPVNGRGSLSEAERGEGLPVLFVDEETGFQQLWPRLHAAIQGHHTDEGPPFYFTTLAGYNFRDDEDAKVLNDRALGLGVGLIVIDALADLMNTAENSVASVQTVLFNLRRLADFTRAAVLVIHHTNRRGFFRGSSAIAASMDLMLSIQSSPNDSYLEFRTLKARFSAPKPFAASAVFSATASGLPAVHLEPADLRPDSPFSDPVGMPANPRAGLTLSILEFLSKNPNSTREQLFAHCAAHKEGSVKNALYDLVDEKKVIRTNEGTNGKQALYSLSSR